MHRLAAVAVLLVALAAPASAEPGDVDAAWGFFGRAGLTESPAASTLTRDGRIVTLSPAGGGTNVRWYGTDGRQSGTARLEGLVGNDVVEVDDGYLVAGSVQVEGQLGTRMAIAKLRPDGAPETTWGRAGAGYQHVDTDAGRSAGATAVAALPDGSAYLVGSSQTGVAPGCITHRIEVARLLPNGALDTGFGGDGAVSIELHRGEPDVETTIDAVSLADGRLVLGATYLQGAVGSSHCFAVGGTQRGALVALRADGTTDTTFGFNGIVALEPVGGLARSGDTLVVSAGTSLRRYSTTGRLESTAGATATGPVDIGPAGEAYVSGRFAQDQVSSARVARFGPDGRPDQAFGLCGATTPGGERALRTHPLADGSAIVVTEDALVRLQGARGGVAGPTRTGEGNWTVATDGGIFTQGDALFCGSTGNLRLNQPIVGMSVLPSRNGYRFVAADGGVFNFGHARFFGSTGDRRLNQPVVGMATTPSGNGYWLVARDGGIFSFGDARFLGSTGAIRLRSPIVGMAATTTGRGYWLVAADGGIFAFGDARFMGSTGGQRLGSPVVGMAVRPSGDGYWLVTRDGRTFGFGRAPQLGKSFQGNVVGIAAAGDERVWLAHADGTVEFFSYTSTEFAVAGAPARRLTRPLVGIAGG